VRPTTTSGDVPDMATSGDVSDMAETP